jgi:predicted negative regulator of RcsB-dependent stress response
VAPVGRPAGAPVSPAAAQLARAGAALVAEAPERAVVLLALALRADRAAAEDVLAALDAAEPAPAHAAAFFFVRGEACRAAGRHEESRIAYASAESLALAPVETDAPRSPQ